MPKNPQEFADLLGAKLVGQTPNLGVGPFGMARLAHLMHQRLTPSLGERPGRPTDATWGNRPKVPMSEMTQRRLAEIAEEISTPERRVSPMQVAAQLLEEAVAHVQVSPELHLGEVERMPQTPATSEAAMGKSTAQTRPAGPPTEVASKGAKIRPRPRTRKRVVD
jgi:hypothetical protein